MFVIVGSVIVVVCVIGGYMAMGGKLAVLNQPFELMIIGGAAVGALILANTKEILTGVGKSFGRMIKGPKHKREGYL